MRRDRGDRPNILVIITDEEREPVWVPEGFSPPARAALASRGLRVTGHHIHAQPCTPSRSTLVTGRHVTTTRMADNVNFHWQRAMCPPGEGGPATWATMLATAGYRCSWIGKWHLGGAHPRSGLARYGFADWTGPDVHGTPLAGRFHDRVTGGRARRWLAGAGRADGGPWLLVVSFVNPHDIWLYPRVRNPGVPMVTAPLPDTLYDDLSGRPEAHRRWREVCDLTGGRVRDETQWQRIADDYLGLQLEVDGHIAAVLAALRASGREADTVVVHTSDHGDMAGAHGLRQKGPLVYREVVNVPLTIAWPGRTDGGRVSRALTGGIDLAPTLCGIAGVDEDVARERWALPGRSLLPLLDDPGAEVRSEVLFTADAHSSMGPAGPIRGFLRGFTDGRWKFARYFLPGGQRGSVEEQQVELYDLDADPHETRELAGDAGAASTVQACLQRLDALIAREVGEDDHVPDLPRRVPHLVRALQGVSRLEDGAAVLRARVRTGWMGRR